MRFKDKVAIVTGSSRGIGRAIAIAFAREGADLVLAARSLTEREAYRPGTIAATAEEVRALGRRALVIKTDVGVQGDVEEMVARAIREFGRIDILVNNAWNVEHFKMEPLNDLTPEKVDAQIGTFKGVLNCCRAVLPHMRKQKYGRIINITSIGGKSKMVWWPVYAGLKAGVAQFSGCLAQEAYPDGITVNCVAPGFTKGSAVTEIYPPQFAANVEANRRAVAGEDVANMVLFLASDEASFVTGEHISVSGG